jgi:hypothetical protein
MLGLGALSSALGKRFALKVMTVGAALVVALGMSMFAQGWSLSGLASPLPTAPAAAYIAEGVPTDPTDVAGSPQTVNSVLTSGRYPDITVQAGAPVKWVIDAPQGSINGCNNRMYIQEYGIEHQFKTGENVIEFTPDKVGTFRYRCWMGMISGTITVV